MNRCISIIVVFALVIVVLYIGEVFKTAVLITTDNSSVSWPPVNSLIETTTPVLANINTKEPTSTIPVTTSAPRVTNASIVVPTSGGMKIPSGTTANDQCAPSWRHKLYTPTFVAKIKSTYFIVDCWHHRVISSTDIDAPVSQWKDLTADEHPSRHHQLVKIPHSVAWPRGDHAYGDMLVIESSVGGSKGTNHSILSYVYDEKRSTWEFDQERVLCHSAKRPHRVVYDGETDAFYVYFTSPPHVAKFVVKGESRSIVVEYCQELPFMKGVYARSIAIVDGLMYITAGPSVVWAVEYKKQIKPVRKYPIRPIGFRQGKMNDLAFIDGWWYATSTVPCGILRFRDIGKMHDHEVLTKVLKMCEPTNRAKASCSSGTPYFVTAMDGRIFVPYIFGCSGVISFVDVNGTVTDVKQHFGGGWVEKDDDLCVRGNKW